MRAAALALVRQTSALRAVLADYAELVKARLTLLVVLTTLMGFYLASVGPVDVGLMTHAVLSTALVAAGAAALNQWLEMEPDARMRRTKSRPLPGGRMAPIEALGFGLASTLVGVAWLAIEVNTLSAILAAITSVTYLFVYTPLKRITWLNTLVGAVPGAIPPLIGWAAARGELTAEAWILFGIMFLWQMPHFMAIAWVYRDDYAGAGFKMLPVVEPDGASTARQSVLHASILLPISLLPTLLGIAGSVYFWSALVLSALFLAFALEFQRQMRPARAWALFAASIVYLPLLLGMMVFDKISR